MGILVDGIKLYADLQLPSIGAGALFAEHEFLLCDSQACCHLSSLLLGQQFCRCTTSKHKTNRSTTSGTWAIPVTEIGTPCRVYTRDDSTFRVIVLREILDLNRNLINEVKNQGACSRIQSTWCGNVSLTKKLRHNNTTYGIYWYRKNNLSDLKRWECSYKDGPLGLSTTVLVHWSICKLNSPLSLHTTGIWHPPFPQE